MDNSYCKVEVIEDSHYLKTYVQLPVLIFLDPTNFIYAICHDHGSPIYFQDALIYLPITPDTDTSSVLSGLRAQLINNIFCNYIQKF